MAASRDWICVRLATFESQEEADYLQKFFGRRDLPNTTFMLLSPDGKPLTRTHRGPGSMVRRQPADALADMLREEQKAYKPKGTPKALPQGLDFRRALNVASCDTQPLLVVVGPKGSSRDAVEKRIAELAWSEKFVGRVQYIVTEPDESLKAIEYESDKPAVLLVTPGMFGLTGKITKQLPLGSSKAAIGKQLDAFLDAFAAPNKDYRDHVRQGRRQGVKWQTEIKQTDGAAYRREQAREKAKAEADKP